MSFSEKKIIAAIFSLILVFGIYFAVVYSKYQNGYFAGEDAMSLLGQSVLILCAVCIVTIIIMTVIFNVIFCIAKREENPSFIVDERDKLIELKGSHVSDVVSSMGFMIAMIALSLGSSTFLVLNMLIAAFAIGAVISNIAKLLIYRKGGMV